jgi:predicted nuclease of restriction endonuclease-like (RecB) superfamily
MAFYRNLLYMWQVAAVYSGSEFTQQPVAQLPWSHHVVLLDKVKDEQERLFYTCKAIENGWSRNVLSLQIKSNLYHRQGEGLTNFELKLPAPQSDLAREMLKDPYVFDFLSLQTLPLWAGSIT